jgi:hypothetical protein
MASVLNSAKKRFQKCTLRPRVRQPLWRIKNRFKMLEFCRLSPLPVRRLKDKVERFFAFFGLNPPECGLNRKPNFDE